MTKEDVRRQLEHNSSWKLLNQIEPSGIATKKLLKIIPEETVSTILRVFRELNRLSEIEDYGKLHKKDKWPITALENIRKKLINIRLQGFLYVNDTGDIMAVIEERIKQGPKQIPMLQAIGKAVNKKRDKGTNTPDLALNMAVYLLANCLGDKWKLICDFLSEQKIINVKDVTLTETHLRDRNRKTEKAALQKKYQGCRELWLYPEGKIDRRITGTYQQMIYLRDITLPPWDELFT